MKIVTLFALRQFGLWIEAVYVGFYSRSAAECNQTLYYRFHKTLPSENILSHPPIQYSFSSVA
jgi:hypothetical protein